MMISDPIIGNTIMASSSSLSSSKKVSLAAIDVEYNLGPYDIICSRNSEYQRNPGNIRYSALVHQHAEAYHGTNSKQEKINIRRQVEAAILAKGGRFLKIDHEQGGALVDITGSKGKVREKIAHALRGADPSRRQVVVPPRKMTTTAAAASRQQLQDQVGKERQVAAAATATATTSSKRCISRGSPSLFSQRAAATDSTRAPHQETVPSCSSMTTQTHLSQGSTALNHNPSNDYVVGRQQELLREMRRCLPPQENLVGNALMSWNPTASQQGGGERRDYLLHHDDDLLLHHTGVDDLLEQALYLDDPSSFPSDPIQDLEQVFAEDDDSDDVKRAT